MKITDIIITETLEAKLSSYIAMMRKGMTLGEFKGLMRNSAIDVVYTYRQDDGMDPDEIESATASMNVTEEGKVMTFNLRGGMRGPSPTITVNDINGFVNDFSHEMSHAFQMHGGKNGMDFSKQAPYKRPRAEGSTNADYYLQAIERPAFLQSVGAELSEKGIEPSEFFDTITEIQSWSYGYFHKLLKNHDPEEAVKKMELQLFKELRGESDFFSDASQGAGIAVSYIQAVLGAKFINNDPEELKRITNQFNSFKRSLQKKFKSLKAYHQTGMKHKPE